MKHLMSIAMALLMGCANMVRKKVPLWKLVRSIAQERYILNYNDCSNKSAKYFHAVKAKGHDPSIIVYKVQGQLHAVVRVNATYIDCTRGTSTLFRPRDITLELKEEDFSKYGNEYKVRE